MSENQKTVLDLAFEIAIGAERAEKKIHEIQEKLEDLDELREWVDDAEWEAEIVVTVQGESGPKTKRLKNIDLFYYLNTRGKELRAELSDLKASLERAAQNLK
jgi:hypothetical protein